MASNADIQSDQGLKSSDNAGAVKLRVGLWDNNPALVQLLGLCPLLAVSNTLANALGLAIATLIVTTLSCLLISASRHLVREQIRLPIFVLIIASAVTAIELSLEAWLPGLNQSLGIFLPLIVTNCMILGRADAFARHNAPMAAMMDGLGHGLGFGWVLIVLGGLRELMSKGSLFSGSEQMLGISIGPAASNHFGLLLAALPCGAFITLGLLVAGRNWWEQRRKAGHTAHPASSDIG